MSRVVSKKLIWLAQACIWMVAGLLCFAGFSVRAEDAFTQGKQAYAAGDFKKAVAFFNGAATKNPAAGVFQNLGNANWKNGDAGNAILAWERAQWIAPLNATVREDLRFARRARLLETPELSWPEICSTWLPASAWAWLACLSFWFTLAMLLLPGIFRWRRAAWHQSLAAASFAIFLLTIPALIGIQTRAKIGVILSAETSLRLTPTAEGQSIQHLAAGETVRLQNRRGHYWYVRASSASGWIEGAQFALVCAGR